MTLTKSALILFAASAAAVEPGPARRVHELAVERVRPADAPKASDVIMRSLSLHPARAGDPRDTMKALIDFHVTRLEWAYITDKPFIERVRASGRVFGGAASAPAYRRYQRPDNWEELCVKDLEGAPIIAPWKRAWKSRTLWGCMNNPELERGYIEYLQHCLDAGSQVMQRDEPGGNENASNWGGCFCEHCMTAFKAFLSENTTPAEQAKLGIEDLTTFDYRDLLRARGAPVGDRFATWNGGPLKDLFLRFQREATIAFHQRTRKALDEHAGRRVSMSCNNGCRRWTEVEMGFDWCFGELSYQHATPGFIHEAMQEATRRDRHQVVTMPKKSNVEHPEAWERLTRQTIAMTYACGGHCMVPWDVYMPGEAPRYFGTPDQYADLFAFIRAAARHLDGYEYAGAFGYGVECDLYADSPPVLMPSATVSAVIRAIPGDTEAPVVIHLVDWSETPEPFTLALRPSRLFGDRPLRLRLFTPAPFDGDVHKQAEDTHAYDNLAKCTQLADGYVASVRVPRLSPWGILVVEPATGTAPGVWPPVVWPMKASSFRETLVLRVESASEKASLHVTLDGSNPTTASPRVTGPLTLERDTVVKALAVGAGGAVSPVVTAVFRRTKGAAQALTPDAPELRENLKLWLEAEGLASALSDGDSVERWPATVGPDAEAGEHRMPAGGNTGPPTFAPEAMNGRPAIRFDGEAGSLAVRGFANRCLAGRSLTVLMVTRSQDNAFGICGNGLAGGGGDPRLYMQRSAFRYDVLNRPVAVQSPGPGPLISAFMHDGDETASAAANGVLGSPVSGLPVVAAFGSGGNLAMPFLAGNSGHAGDIAEVIVYDRKLTDEERRGVERYLAAKYAIGLERRWTRVE